MFHPAAYLFVWLIFAVFVQFYHWTALVLTIGILLLLVLRSGAWRRWLKQLSRAKWLFLSLWLILSYGTPGDLWLRQAWAPSVEGMEIASLHAMRLVILLGSIACLFESLPQPRFIAGLWQLLQPLRYLGLDVDRSVARLALVFDYLEHAPAKGSWRHFLDLPHDDGRHVEVLKIELIDWQKRDVWLLLTILLLPLLILLP